MPEPFSLRSKWTILPFLKFILTPRLHHAVQSPDMLFRAVIVVTGQGIRVFIF